MARSPLTTIERFLTFVRIDPDGCHRWTGSLDKKGYSKFRLGKDVCDKRRTVLGYHWLWVQKHGPVPKGLELDHLCRHPECVNDAHLEPVTRSVNQKRGTGGIRLLICPKKLHPMNGTNVIVRSDGKRNCRACKNAALKQARRRARPSRAKIIPIGSKAIGIPSRRIDNEIPRGNEGAVPVAPDMTINAR